MTVSGSTPRAAVAVRFVVVVVSTLVFAGCVGAVSDPGVVAPSDDASPGPTFEAPSSPAEAAERQRRIDEEMEREDPALYDLATRFFPGDALEAPAPRLVRLSRVQLDQSARALLPDADLPSAASFLPADPRQENYEYSDNLRLGAAQFDPLRSWVEGLASRVERQPELVLDCPGAAAACVTEQARSFALRAFRGTAPPQVLDRYATLAAASVDEVGIAATASDLLRVALTSPRFLFRDEVRSEDGVLEGAQRLQLLSYTFGDAPPDAFGVTLADARAAETILASTLARSKLRRFFEAWLEVDGELEISTMAFPELTAPARDGLRLELTEFLNRSIEGPSPSLLDIVSSDDSFVPASTAFIYGLQESEADRWVQHDPGQRRGVFTLPAFIAAHSGPVDTRLVRRGVFFTRKVLCQPLGAPPSGAALTIPEDENATERQRVEAATSDGACAGCHQFINPFGSMLESYDPIGRFRDEDEAGRPIDASVDVGFLPEGPLVASGATETLETLGRSAQLQQCFTRQLFRFYLGRDEEPGDNPLLRELFFELASDPDQDIAALLRTFATSPHLVSRQEAQP